MSPFQIESFLLLTFLSLSYSTALRRVERLRRGVTLDRVPDMAGLWTFAGAVMLPLPLVVALLTVVNLGEWPSRKVVENGRPFKYAVSTAGNAAWYIAAAQIIRVLPLPVGVPLAVIAFCSLNVGFIASLIWFSGNRAALPMLTNGRMHAVEVATQSLGAGMGTAMLWSPLAAFGALPVLVGLHYRALRHSIEDTKAFDPTSGLWSETAWRLQASCLLEPGRFVTVMIIDIADAGRESDLIAEVRRCLSAAAVLGRCATQQIAIAAPAGIAEGGALLAGRIRAQTTRAGISCTVASATSDYLKIPHLVIEAMSDLLRQRALLGSLDYS